MKPLRDTNGGFTLIELMASMAILGAIVLIRRGERAMAVKAPEAVPMAAAVETSEECA